MKAAQIKPVLLGIILITLISGCAQNSAQPPLPAPVGEEGSPFGIDANINMQTIDNYLGRDDVCYRDMRLLFDSADYEAIGGEADLSRTIQGFKIVPYPYMATLPNLPVKGAYNGPCLYTLTWDNSGGIISATPNYTEAELIITELFPKDKAIFLMCGGGGYAGMMKDLLIFLGWDSNLLYNIGANWSYNGGYKQEIIVYPENPAKNITYATWRADYAYIDFYRLNEVNDENS